MTSPSQPAEKALPFWKLPCPNGHAPLHLSTTTNFGPSGDRIRCGTDGCLFSKYTYNGKAWKELKRKIFTAYDLQAAREEGGRLMKEAVLLLPAINENRKIFPEWNAIYNLDVSSICRAALPKEEGND